MKEGWWWKFGMWQSSCVKKTFSAKIAIFSLKMTQLKICLCLTQAQNTAMQICRYKGATNKSYRKSVMAKF